jgi:hypothetical protein
MKQGRNNRSVSFGYVTAKKQCSPVSAKEEAGCRRDWGNITSLSTVVVGYLGKLEEIVLLCKVLASGL